MAALHRHLENASTHGGRHSQPRAGGKAELRQCRIPDTGYVRTPELTGETKHQAKAQCRVCCDSASCKLPTRGSKDLSSVNRSRLKMSLPVGLGFKQFLLVWCSGPTGATLESRFGRLGVDVGGLVAPRFFRFSIPDSLTDSNRRCERGPPDYSRQSRHCDGGSAHEGSPG